MNTIEKLSKAIAQRGLSMHVKSPPDGWEITLFNQERSVSAKTEFQLETAIMLALKKWDAGAGGLKPDHAVPCEQEGHPDLPGHELCWRPLCSVCRAKYTPGAGEPEWMRCLHIICPECVHKMREWATKPRQPMDYYAGLEYPVTMYLLDDGRLLAECRDLPGCVWSGDTPLEVWKARREARVAWLETAASHFDRIPLPAPTPED
jgi:predicted RNase H-like HicB family nuclease